MDRGRRIKFVALVLGLAVVLVLSISGIAFAVQYDWVPANQPNMSHFNPDGGGILEWHFDNTGATIENPQLHVTFVDNHEAVYAGKFLSEGVTKFTSDWCAAVKSAYVTYDLVSPSGPPSSPDLKIVGNPKDPTQCEEATPTTVKETPKTVKETPKTVKETPKTVKETTTTVGRTTVGVIQTGGGGTSGPGTGTWALGLLALALAGGLGWTAVRPALKRK